MIFNQFLLERLIYKTTIVFRNYRDNCNKRRCSSSHKQCKTLLKDHVVRFKIISLYIYKDLRLRSNESRDHYHEDGNLVPSSPCGFCFEGVLVQSNRAKNGQKWCLWSKKHETWYNCSLYQMKHFKTGTNFEIHRFVDFTDQNRFPLQQRFFFSKTDIVIYRWKACQKLNKKY